MAMNKLMDKGPFSRFRVPLDDILPFLKQDNGGVVLPTGHPSRRFRSHQGFYLTQAFFDCFIRRLQLPTRPSIPKEQSLFVWQLQEDCQWSAVMRHFDGSRQPVPWWVIQPLLQWQMTGEQRPLVPMEISTLFFMEALDAEKNPEQALVSLSFAFSSLHGEWRVDIVDTSSDRRCCQDQVFLSVA